MDLEDYRTAFMVVSLALILIVVFPVVSLVVPFPSGVERFSELWVLGPNHMAGDYPFNVTVNEEYHVFVGVGNHMGYSARYMVCVKFRNRTQPLPNMLNSKSSPLSPLYEFQAFVADGATWEVPVTFAFLEVSRFDNSCLIRRMSINDVVFWVDSPSSWDSENSGFYYQLLFELWLYNVTSQSFQFHNRFVGIWLNVTAS